MECVGGKEEKHAKSAREKMGTYVVGILSILSKTLKDTRSWCKTNKRNYGHKGRRAQ